MGNSSSSIEGQSVRTGRGRRGEYGNDDDDDDDYAQQFDGIETLGYRVLGVQPNSPASVAGLVSFLDFIVGANEQMLLGSGEHLEEGEEYDDVDFPSLLRDNIGRTVELLVWNIKAQEKRIVHLVPRDDWGGAGLLGVTIRLDNYGGAEERMVRVLDVQPHSPAAVAGLVPEYDFLLGTTACALESTDVLASVLYDHMDRVVELYVYNSNSDMVRVVGLLPTYNWQGGTGLLGAEVGTGYLHRLPNSCRSTIGQSVERKVHVVDITNTSLGEDNVQLEPHLEMEIVDDDDDDHRRTAVGAGAGGVGQRHPNSDDGDHIGLAAPRRTKQPHELGRPIMPSTPSKAPQPSNTQSQSGGREEAEETLTSIVPLPSSQVHGDSSASHIAVDDGGSANATTSRTAATTASSAPPSHHGPTVGTPQKKQSHTQASIPPPPPPPQPTNTAALLFSGPPPPPDGQGSAAVGVPPPPPPPPLARPAEGMESNPMMPPPPPQPISPSPTQPLANRTIPQDKGDFQKGDEYDEYDDDDDADGDDEAGEYTDDDEEEDDEDDDGNDNDKKKPPASGGGFFRSFMPAPPKMHY